jgi:hypothetical protein
MALTDNLVSYWTLDESSDGSGAITRNDSHGTNHLTDNNTTASAAGIISNGADFELSNSERLSIADASQTGLDLSGDFSFSFWLSLEQLPSTAASVFRFFDKQVGGTTRSYTILSNNNVSNGIEVEVYGDGTTSNRRIGTSPVNTFSAGDVGVFRHIVCTFTLSGGTVRIYKDAVSQTITTNNAGSVASIFNSANAFAIGGRSDGAAGNFVDGIIDEVGVWNRVLTSDEVTELYNGGAGLAYPFTGTPVSVRQRHTLLTLGVG